MPEVSEALDPQEPQPEQPREERSTPMRHVSDALDPLGGSPVVPEDWTENADPPSAPPTEGPLVPQDALDVAVDLAPSSYPEPSTDSSAPPIGAPAVAVSPTPRAGSLRLPTSARPQATVAPSTGLRLEAARELLRVGQVAQARPLLDQVMRASPTPEAGALLVSCLRRLGLLDEASDRLAELLSAYPDHGDLLAEAGWILLAREIEPLLERGLLNNAVLAAQELCIACPDARVRRTTVFAIIKKAKERKHWAVIDAACDLVDPSTLGDKPPPKLADGWSDRARWYAAKIGALTHTNRAEQALDLAERAAAAFPAHATFFRRSTAQALTELGQLEEAKAIYLELSGRTRRPDWWLLQELGAVCCKLGAEEEGLQTLCRAASACGKIEMAVQLLAELAACALRLGRADLAGPTADLVIQLRQRNGWRVPASVCDVLAATGPIQALPEAERLRECRRLWRAETGEPEPVREENRPRPTEGSSSDRRRGRLMRPDSKCAFCFIRSKGERVFCLVADLPEGVSDGDELEFRTVRSFDKKRQQDSWRAADVRRVQHG